MGSLLVRQRAQRRSPQARRKAKRMVATIPGAITGKTILKNTPILVQPSTIAHWSSSTGTLSIKPFIIQVEKGRQMVRKAMIKPVRVSYRPTLERILKYGPTNSTPGNIWVARKKPMRKRLPLKKNLEKPYPAKAPKKVASTAVASDIIVLLKKYMSKFFLTQMPM